MKLDNPQVYLTSNDGVVLYRINGDKIYSFTKKDCAFRIRQLFRAGYYDKELRDILLQQLKSLKRP